MNVRPPGEGKKNPCDSQEHSIFEPENTKWCLFPAAPCNGLGDCHHPEPGLGSGAAKSTNRYRYIFSTSLISQPPPWS